MNISGLNLLRCELQYRYKDKIKPLKNFLNPESKTDNLTIATMLDLLRKNKLYSRLDSFYISELQSVPLITEKAINDIINNISDR